MPNSVTFFCEKFWGDPDILEMSPDIKLLYVYTITCSQRSCSGVFTLPIKRISFETSISEQKVKKLLKELESKYEKIIYDFKLQQIFVFTILKLMPKTKQIIVSAKNDFKFNTVSSRIVKKFLSIYQWLDDVHPNILTDTDTDT
ncbi:hypothetical protein KAR91_07170, partial [Candidatus Pacearchaeota archaeon]|nr:hypothetical protein [Candidatus Pacearchaeota archaeon]